MHQNLDSSSPAVAALSGTNCDRSFRLDALCCSFLCLITSYRYPFLPTFFGAYLLAQFAGVVSTVPGGLGIFETVILLRLHPSVSSSLLLGTLVVYRVIYYLLPLVGAIGLLGLYELRQRSA